ncbi:NAD(P)/FAD-dependent oxidoreductase [Psychromarinibacter sp. C21-152]|uniref:NAD(P)/FAD-dependent oxidoreductase n=1 Tax=Psychromarinibacter sediminicola TaxID=3033385 RepID=A0AAE3TC37_9RHOB|nr:NAD(P)/FAD-dependent oxidoreductase [Psychromarinibacter sediminicola]MDF0603534.1 NAD(P)/FAD-dependent oxidoreductase [Psychromarinibacter sediminicola]
MTPSASSSVVDSQGLARLEAQVQDALGLLCYPGKPWIPQREGVTDVVIVGGGMCGMLAWFALTGAGITNIRILDRNPAGLEGPWLNYARMETLRSPKELTGPSYGQAYLTFQAWYRAQYGAEAWRDLDKIPRPMWMEYLRWYRRVLNVPVENGVSVDRIGPEDELIRVQHSGAQTGSFLARKVIFATGRDGTGQPSIPDFVGDLPRTYWAHTADDIDFPALAGKKVAVIGVGASAVDNAAEALEHGAAEVRHLIRRKQMPTINKMTGIGSPGFTAGFAALPDEWRWRFMRYSFATQTPPPHGSTLRVSRHANAHFHFGKAVAALREDRGRVRIELADGDRYVADFVILGTGFTVDPLARSEFGPAAEEIRLWKDAYQPPEGEASRDLGAFPYLNPDFTFSEKRPGTAPWIGNVYCFNYGATASLGKVSGDIPGVSDGAAWLARALCATLYREDVLHHWQRIQEYDEPELDGSEWTPTDLPVGQEKGAVA